MGQVVPTGDKNGLQNRGDLPCHAQVGIPPRREIFATIEVLLAHVEPAQVADLAINYNDFAMITVAQGMEF